MIEGYTKNRNPEPAQAIATREPSEMEQRLHMLESVIGSLYGVVDDLTNQLRPIMNEVDVKQPPLGSGPIGIPKSVHIIAQIEQHAGRIANIVDDLRGVRSRLHI